MSGKRLKMAASTSKLKTQACSDKNYYDERKDHDVNNLHCDLHNWVTVMHGTVCQFNLSFLVVATLIPVLNFYREDLENWQQF